MAILGNPFVLILIGIVVIVGIYLLVTRRRKELAAFIRRKPGENKDRDQ
jgi:LPXTG-motif cell wall-anchored protein